MRVRRDCRLCNSQELDFVFSFPLTPLADRYADGPNSVATRFPQDVYVCRNCSHVQIVNVIAPTQLFDETYTYRPSRNVHLSDHWVEYAKMLIQRIGHVPEKVLDIGSNDGSLLLAFKQLGSTLCLGVEPVKKLTEQYVDLGLSSVNEYWTVEAAEALLSRYGKFDLVCANNVFAHADDLQGFVAGITVVVKNDGYFSTEFSYLEDIISSGLVGVFFHEHLSHHHLLALIPFLKDHGLYAIDARKVRSQGGAVVLLATPQTADVANGLIELIDLERESLPDYQAIRSRLLSSLLDYRNIFIERFKGLDLPERRLVLFGASRSANLLVDFLGIRARVDIILDSNPQKLGHYLFESRARILDLNSHVGFPGDIVVVTAWAQTSILVSRAREIYGAIPFTVISLFPGVSVQDY